MLIPNETYIYLIQQGNGSDYVRGLIDQDRLSKADPEFIKLKKKELQDQLKALGEMEKISKKAPEKVNQVLQKHYESFKQNNRMMAEDHFNWNWIEAKVIPDLKGLSCKLDKKEILVIFQEHFREDKVLINVR